MIINILGIDIAKNTFQLHGTDAAGKACEEAVLLFAKDGNVSFTNNRAERFTHVEGETESIRRL